MARRTWREASWDGERWREGERVLRIDEWREDQVAGVEVRGA